SKIDKLEKYIRKQILLQNIIQFIIFAIFFVFMILLSKYKKETTKIEDKIDDVSTKIEENKKETIRLLIEKAKDDPKLTLALKNILEEKQSEK
ncbi:MAG: viral A-type inclusion protein, partial [Hydrogenothermaceae bacterium]